MKVMDKEILLNDHNRPDGHHGHLVCTWIKQNNDKNFFAKKHFSCLLPLECFLPNKNNRFSFSANMIYFSTSI